VEVLTLIKDLTLGSLAFVGTTLGVVATRKGKAAEERIGQDRILLDALEAERAAMQAEREAFERMRRERNEADDDRHEAERARHECAEKLAALDVRLSKVETEHAGCPGKIKQLERQNEALAVELQSLRLSIG
jgi:chromosome segregation ATPase